MAGPRPRLTFVPYTGWEGGVGGGQGRRPWPSPHNLFLMRKGDFRVDFFRVEDFGVGGFPAVGGQAPEEAGLVAQFAGAAGGPHLEEQSGPPSRRGGFPPGPESVPRPPPWPPPCVYGGGSNGPGRWRPSAPGPPDSDPPASTPCRWPRPE